MIYYYVEVRKRDKRLLGVANSSYYRFTGLPASMTDIFLRSSAHWVILTDTLLIVAKGTRYILVHYQVVTVLGPTGIDRIKKVYIIQRTISLYRNSSHNNIVSCK